VVLRSSFGFKQDVKLKLFDYSIPTNTPKVVFVGILQRCMSKRKKQKFQCRKKTVKKCFFPIAVIYFFIIQEFLNQLSYIEKILSEEIKSHSP